VTERRAAERSEARFRRLIETSAEAFIAVDAGGLITEWNHQAEVTFGWSRAEAVGRSLVDTIIPPDDPGSQTAGLARSLAARKAPIMGQRLEIEGRHRDGTRFPLELTIWALDDGPQLSFNMLLHDISNRRRLEEELWELALVDDLTAVHNRRAFILLAEQAIKAAVRAKRPVIGVFVDVDGLKCINDTYGHAEGDRVLRLVADGLRSACREADIIGRLGGDEFAVLLAEATEISGLEARIRSRLDDARAGTLPAVSVSIGTARCEPNEDCHLDELFARADQAMYQDKLKRR
jgi:diguanylate cyclase (GGDEF)-like protein/PAS domain S-box-containing protein